MRLYCAIDLHSTNNIPVVINEDDRVLFEKRLLNGLNSAIQTLIPLKNKLHSVAVDPHLEGIDRWTQQNGFSTELVNPVSSKVIQGY